MARRKVTVTALSERLSFPLTRRLRTALCVAAAFAAVALIAWHLVLGARNPDLTTMDQQQFLAHLEAVITHGLREDNIPGASVLLVRDGEPIWSAAFGSADRERRVTLSTDDVMMAHSISKSVTAWGVMRLVDQGRVGLDDPVVDYLGGWRFPDSRFDERAVTVRRLLSLNAGVALGPIGVHYSPHETVPPLEESVSGDAVRLVREPGTGFSYSNSSFAILELLIERVTGRPFAEYMEVEVLHPLGMLDSSFSWDPSWNVPLGYEIDGSPVAPFLYPNRASGGLFSTIHDLGRFAAATIGASTADAAPATLSVGARSEMHTPQIAIPGIFGVVADTYGLGHFLEQLPGGYRAVWHGGQGLGWMTHVHAIPETGDAIVILTNSQRSWPFMARVLDDWSRWIGVGPVGMARITVAVTGMRILVGLLLLVALWRTLTVFVDLADGRRRPAFGRFAAVWPRGIELMVALLLAGTVVWASQQDYLFITSVFPREAPRFAASLIAVATALALSALVPVQTGRTASRT
ncbi:MAG: class A beta-lactamase-related serine hydrolase [Spirochaetaceae bacterium]|nr:MAG: class A beta-lactamase-related serine hydrolase [Spirochaetaceae bacterium]